MGGDDVLFEHRDARVTASSIYVRASNSTYFLSQVTSIRVTRRPSGLVNLGALLVLCGAFFVITAWSRGSIGFGLGAIACLSSGLGLMTVKPWFTLVVTTSAGQISALTSQDRGLVDGVHEAVLRGMARR